ncbi:major facilitator superfamily domain-containing protein [Xylariales sp. PMI_506]|nr:major facilitator superfamily domain-containing protein [Xylariales sp. PMI_506]
MSSIPPEKQASWTSSTASIEDELEDVCLDEETELEQRDSLPTGVRPLGIRNFFHECLFVALIALAAASSVFVQRSVTVIVPDIGNALHLSPAEVAWINGAYGLTTGAFLIPFGYLADICPVTSRKYILLLSLTAFSLIVAFTSFSSTGVMMDIMCGVAGITCAATIPMAVGFLSVGYPTPSRRKNVVFSSFLMGNPAATMMGGLGSGGLATMFNWKATFIFLGILYALVTILSWLIIPETWKPQSELEDQISQHSIPEAILDIEPTHSTSLKTILLGFNHDRARGRTALENARGIAPSKPGTSSSRLFYLMGDLKRGSHDPCSNLERLECHSSGVCSVTSNILLIFLQQESDYLALVLPALFLSTVGMDWTMNVGLLHMFSILPLDHHSAGASVVQTASRLGIPLGMTVTAAVWSSYSGKGYDIHVAYSKAFTTAAAFASFSLAIAPFVRIGRQGCETQKASDEEIVEDRPSKRWSIVETLPNRSMVSNKETSLPTTRTLSVQSTTIAVGGDNDAVKCHSLQSANSKRIVWVVCQQCHANRQVKDPVGDPARYFNDVGFCLPEKPNHDMIVNGSRRRFPLVVKNKK